MPGSRSTRNHAVAPPARRGLPGLATSTLAILLLGGLPGCLALDHQMFVLGGPAGPRELVVEFATIDLPPASGEIHTPRLEPVWLIAPFDGWIHGYTVEMVDVHGAAVPSSVLHHVLLMTPEYRELFQPTMLRMLGAGAETQSASVPRSVGIPIQGGDSLLATAMIHNGLPMAFEGVRIRMRLEVTPSAGSPAATALYPFYIPVTGSELKAEFDLPPGRSTRSWDASPAIAGEIVGIGGHVHRYAVELRLEDLTSGKVLWRSRIRTDANGEVVAIRRTVHRFRRGPKLLPEHTYRATVVYENPTEHTLVDAGMASVVGLVRPLGEWPRVDRDDPLYVLYRDDQLRDRSDEDHHAHSH